MLELSSLNENAQKWVRALRSGLFKQGDGFLNQTDIDGGGNRFCCLGVACELAILDGVEVYKTKKKEHYLYDDSSGLLPQPVMDWLGLRTNEGSFDCYIVGEEDEFGYSSQFNSLTELNDHAGYSFDQIADFVEKNPDGLFKRNQ